MSKKNHVWVVEILTERGVVPFCNIYRRRMSARAVARQLRQGVDGFLYHGDNVRVTKYVPAKENA